MADNTIAERTLSFAAEPSRRLTVRLAKPDLNRDADEYRCHYEIVGEGVEIARYAVGLDAFQALQCAILLIGADIVHIEQIRATDLRWLDGDAGFPRP